MNTTQNTEKIRRTFSVLVENRPGVLSIISRLFSRNGFNIDSFCSGPTTDPNLTRITIEVYADDNHANLLLAQLNKMVPVYSAKMMEPAKTIRREFVLIKCEAKEYETRNEIIQIGNIFRATVIDVSSDTLTLAMIGEENKINALQELLEPFNILELARTGNLAMERGKYTIDEKTKENIEFSYGKNVTE